MTAQISAIFNFFIYFVYAVAITLLFITIYIRITPYKEFELIKNNNIAAVSSLSGALFGFIIPLASAIIHSVGFFDMILWSAIALCVQLSVFLAIKRCLPEIGQAIEEGSIAKGLFLGCCSFAAGIINAACMSY